MHKSRDHLISQIFINLLLYEKDLIFAAIWFSVFMNICKSKIKGNAVLQLWKVVQVEYITNEVIH